MLPRWKALIAATLPLFVLAGCAAEPSGPPAAPTTQVSPSPGTTQTPAAAPTIVPDGSAADNLPVFADVTARVWASEQRASGRAYIDALASAGFDKGAMQVTDDTSTVGNPAESIQFSVQWGDQCLVGQVGPATGEPVTAIVAALAEGGCLIGQTRPIDW